MGSGNMTNNPNWFKQKLTQLFNRMKQAETTVAQMDVKFRDVAVPLLLDNWVLDETNNTYTQSATINGMTDGNNPNILLSSVGEIATDDELESFACIASVITSENTVEFIASEKPSISFTVIVKNVIASEEGSAAVVTELVGKVSELETNVSELNTNLSNVSNALRKQCFISFVISGSSSTTIAKQGSEAWIFVTRGITGTLNIISVDTWNAVAKNVTNDIVDVVVNADGTLTLTNNYTGQVRCMAIFSTP